MKTDEDFMQSEELSRCLDELNAGKYPVMQDKEIEELIEMAALVKESQGQQELPRVLIDKIVDDLATEFGNTKYKRNTHWLYGGVVCAAATVVLALGVQFLIPPTTDKNIAQEMNGSVTEEKVVALTDSVSNSVTPTKKSISEQVATASLEKVTSSEKTSSAIQAEQPAPPVATSITKVIEEIVQVAQVTKEGTSQVAVLEKENLPEKTMQRNVAMTKMRINSAPVSDHQEESTRKSKSLALYAGGDQTSSPVIKDKTIDQENSMIQYGALADGQPQAIIKMKDVMIMVNGKKIDCDGRQPYIKDNGTMMIPLLVVVEALGYRVNWNQQTQVVEIKRSSQWITTKIGTDSYQSDKLSLQSIGDSAEVSKGMIYVPFSFFQEILGVSIFQEKNGNIKINELVH